jgi:GNAT superfamily N-acetyltransferase
MEALQDVEAAAGRLFATIGMTYVSDDPPPPLRLLREYQRSGRAWVAVDPEDRPVAYLLADLVDGNAHVEQVSVDPSAAHRGIGRSLIDHVTDWTRDQGLSSVTLTTFADVPWNGPYYRRCGFRAVPEAEMGPELAALWAREQARELGRRRRVAMARPVSPPRTTRTGRPGRR